MSALIPLTVHSSSSNMKNESEITRRNAGFHPTIWGDYFLKYASESEEVDDQHEQQVHEMKEEVKKMLSVDSPANMQLIDTIQRLGFSYHFEPEISEILEQINKTVLEMGFQNDDLYTISLKFRLLRQQGYYISSDILKQFTNEEGKFKNDLTSDVRGMLSLYEAAHFLVHGESILDEALAFTTAQLESSLTSSRLSPFLRAQVNHALKHPIRKKILRMQAKHFISIYHKDPSHSEILLKFAKLDFNFVQKLHRKEISDTTRWWKDLDFKSKLPFARDRLVECYMWALGPYFEPKYSLGRRILVKFISVLSILDDIYDTYGTLEELRVFTDAVQRWDIMCLDQLPGYMKIIYQALLDIYEEFEGLMVTEGRGAYQIHYAKEQMKKHVKCFFNEAKWFDKKYVPTVEEYMQLYGIESAGCCIITITALLGVGDIATEEAFEWISKYPKIIRAGSAIGRLMDDIVGHKLEQERGHSASIIECYVKQYGATEEEAYVEFRTQIAEAWKDINEECLEPRVVPMPILMLVVGVARFVSTLYKDENCYTESRGIMKETIKSILVDPIPM